MFNFTAGAFGGPYPGFSEPSVPGESDKQLLVSTHLALFKEQVDILKGTGRHIYRDG